MLVWIENLHLKVTSITKTVKCRRRLETKVAQYFPKM